MQGAQIAERAPLLHSTSRGVGDNDDSITTSSTAAELAAGLTFTPHSTAPRL